jgi:hypothetical protein
VVKRGPVLELLLSLSGIGPFYRQVTIGILPDDVLLEIFKFFLDECPRTSYQYGYDGWHMLVHVCRRWRNVVFASPRRLHLRLLCMPNRSVKEMLDIWPELPIIISDYGWYGRPRTVENVENAISALELKDRVFDIFFRSVSCSDLKRFAAVMRHPFPALTHLEIWFHDEMAPVISDSFLGGSAPRLQSLCLERIPFPALPNLLLSATDLVTLQLWEIPHSGYISPEAIVTCLSALTRLDYLVIRFQSPLSRPPKGSRHRPPLIRTVLPALAHLEFGGVTEYLEDLVARIDAPFLVEFSMLLFNQLVLDFLQLPKFLYRIEKFTELEEADILLDDHLIHAYLYSRRGTVDRALFEPLISCSKLDWQLSSFAQVCNSAFPTLSTFKRLSLGPIISTDHLPGQDDMEDTQWLELLHPFTNVKDLHLSGILPTCIAPALQELTGERVTEVLPVLQNIFLDGIHGEPEPVPKAISEFVAARQLSGCPVAIHRRRQEWKNRTWVWVVIESSTQ